MRANIGIAQRIAILPPWAARLKPEGFTIRKFIQGRKKPAINAAEEMFAAAVGVMLMLFCSISAFNRGGVEDVSVVCGSFVIL